MPSGSGSPSDPSGDVVREHATAARRLAHHLVFDRDLAEDVAQESLRVALERPAAAGRAPKPWIHGIVRNVARAMIRRDGRRRALDARAARDLEAHRRDASTGDPAALVARAEEHRRVIDAVVRLDEPYRSTLILRFIEDLEPAAVARRLFVPVETVRTRVRRGLDLVRADLDAQHGGNRRRWMSLLVPLPTITLPAVPRPSVPAAIAHVAGVFAMKKVAFAVLVLLLAAGVWRFGPATDDDATRLEPVAGPETSIDVSFRETILAGTERKAPRASALPPPVALDVPGVIDRDRDVHGIVVSEGGAPVAGADVVAVRRPWRGSVLLGTLHAKAPSIVGATRSASDGTFALRLGRGDAPTLRVTSSGFAPFEEEAVGAGERLRVVLRPGVRFVVVVKDAAGGAVGNATLALYRLGGPTTWGFVRASYRRYGTTDAAGRFVFEDLPAGGGGTWTMLEVEVPGSGQASYGQVEIPERGETVHEVVLKAARTLRGQVIDAETSKSIAGAVVGLGWGQEPRVTTEAEGTYAISVSTDAASTTVFAEAPGYAWLGRRGERSEGTIDFALLPAATLRGRIVDEKGAPVRNVTLTAHGTMGKVLPTGRAEGKSDANGSFELVGLSPTSPSELWIEATGLGQRGLAIDAIGETRLRELGDIVLSPGRCIEGRAVDTDGTPVAGVYVALRGGSVEQARFWTGTEEPPGRLNETRVTDDLGRFRFADVAPGTYRLTAQAHGQAEQEKNVRVGAEDVVGLTYRLRSGRTLVVHVRGPDGKPVSGTRVQVMLPDGSKHSEEAMNASQVAFTVPDEDVRVQVVGLGRGQRAPEAQLVPRGTDEITITLQIADDWVVDGTVFDPDGEPLAFAVVFGRRSDSPAQIQTSTQSDRSSAHVGSLAQTDHRGRFRLQFRGGDRAEVTVTGDQTKPGGKTTQGAFAADPVEVDRGTTDIIVRTRRLLAGQTLRVVVQDPEGKTLLGIPIHLQRPNYGMFLEPGVVGADGAVEFNELVGRPVMVVRGSGAYTMDAAWVDPDLEVVPAGQTVVYRFLSGTVVRGIVLAPDGAPVPYESVVRRSAGGRLGATQTDKDGRFALPFDASRGFPATLSVWLERPNTAPLVGSTTLESIPSGPVTIRLGTPPPDAK